MLMYYKKDSKIQKKCSIRIFLIPKKSCSTVDYKNYKININQLQERV